MAPRLPSIDGLLAFEAAARLGSLERAAESLNISASAVAKRLTALEDLLGTALLQRGTKPLTLTAVGKEYLEQVRDVLARLGAMPLHQRASQKRERLRITAPPTFARQVLVPGLPAFALLHPTLELELQLSTPYLDDTAPAAEVTIRHGLPGREFAAEWQLTNDTVTPMAAPALLQRLPPIQTPQDLRVSTLLRTPLEPWAPWLQAAGLDWPEPEQGPRFIDLGLTLEAAVCGQGIVLARPSLARGPLRNGALKRLFDLSVAANGQYGLVLDTESESAQAFGAWLRKHCLELDSAKA